ncbi:MAG: hypothetical protein P4L53_03695 [Candidatus Obscuribacterales bacterium]|nr:hypothetical protein [Candidatus Obscuribacterales bacterium]
MGQLIHFDAMRANHAGLDLTDISAKKASMYLSIEIASTRGAVLRPVARIKERIEHLGGKGLTCDALKSVLDEYEAAISAFEQLCPPVEPDAIGPCKTISTVQSKGIQTLQDGLHTIENRLALTERWFSEIRRIERASEAIKFTITSQDYSYEDQWEWSGLAHVGGSEFQSAHVTRLIEEAIANLNDCNFAETERYVLDVEEYILSVLGDVLQSVASNVRTSSSGVGEPS